MPRCANCGKANREGALFCQDCGQKLEDPARKAKALDGPTCPACGAVNPPGMNFCKMCGTALTRAGTPAAGTPVVAAAAQPSAPAPSQPAPKAADKSGPAQKMTCGACGKQTPAGFAFCQHCGQKLGTPAAVVAAQPRALASSAAAAAAAAPEPVTAPQAIAPTVAAVVPTPPAGVKPAPKVEKAALAATVAASAARPAVRQTTPEVAPRPTAPEVTVHGRLVVVRRDGTDGEAHALTGDAADVGRTEGALTFPDDPYLAQRHARFVAQGGTVRVRPIDTVNGVYLRVRGGVDLAPGDQILIGKEVLRYEPLAIEERDPPSLVEHGVRLFGSAQREAWGRLRQITGAGTARDVWHLVRPELVLGREEGDVTFPDDEYMSRRHAAVKRNGQKARLEDLGSSNGTFIRLRGEHALTSGDVLRLGDQLLRFET